MVLISMIIFATAVASYFVGIQVGRRLERMDAEEPEEEDLGDLIQHVGYDEAQCGREK